MSVYSPCHIVFDQGPCWAFSRLPFLWVHLSKNAARFLILGVPVWSVVEARGKINWNRFTKKASFQFDGCSPDAHVYGKLSKPKTQSPVNHIQYISRGLRYFFRVFEKTCRPAIDGLGRPIVRSPFHREGQRILRGFTNNKSRLGEGQHCHPRTLFDWCCA